MNALNNVKLGVKLIGGFAMVALILVGVAAYGFVSLNTVQAAQDEMYKDRLLPISQLGTVEQELYRIRGDVYKFILLPNERSKTEAEMTTAIAEVKKQMDLYRATFLLKEEQEELAKFDAAWAEYQKQVADILAKTKAGKDQEAIALLLEGGAASNARKSSDKAGSQDKTKAVLEERARALSKVTEVQTSEGVPLVVFSLANETYGIATEHIKEVQPLRDITPVPCTPEFVIGVVNIRGSIYSVIDIRSFFGVQRTEIGDSTKVILVNGAGLEVGILADDVKGATSVLLNDIKPPLTTQAAVKEEYIQGVTKEMLIVLNLVALLRDERIIVREEVG
jgi:chemotaxis signal transduction protein/CHASE3 domain sensor protein